MEIVNIYIPGMQSDEKELSKINSLFDDKLEIIDFKSLTSDIELSNMMKPLYSKYGKSIYNKKFNLICHSMGCNYGLILLKEQLVDIIKIDINKLVLISPELWPTTPAEKGEIKQSNIENNFYNEEICSPNLKQQLRAVMSLKQMRLIIKFLKTRQHARKSIELITKYNINTPTMVVRSIGDIFVSKANIEELEQSSLNIKEECIESTMHQPLFSKEGKYLVKKINHFLNQETTDI